MDHYFGFRNDVWSDCGICDTVRPVSQPFYVIAGGRRRIYQLSKARVWWCPASTILADALPHIKYYRHVFAASIYGTPATKCEMADHPRRKDLLRRIGVPGCPVHRAGVPCLAILLIPAVIRPIVIT